MIYPLIFIAILILVILGLLWILKKCAFEGKWEYVIFFLMLYLPAYNTILSLILLATDSREIVMVFQFFKEGVILLGIGSFLLFTKNLTEFPIQLNAVDILFLAFLGLAFFYVLIPLGESAPLNKVLYLKNMLLPGAFYFLGRNTFFSTKEEGRVFRIIFFIAFAAFVVNLAEKALGIHLQNLTGYAYFNLLVNDTPVTGNFGLSWTFETQAMSKRFASFFSDPLELASSVLLGFSTGLIWYLTTKRDFSGIYLLVLVCSFGSLLFSSSRAAFAAFFVMLFFIAIVFKLKKLILLAAFLVLLFVVWVVYLAPEEFYFFVLDTLTFQNPSSAGHLLEWLLSWSSMLENPLGIGLAMSGNMSSVEEDLRLGGENQFLIYGVQLGFLGMGLYIALLFAAILLSIRVFYRTDDVMTARFAFVGATVKVGMLLPLFTANADMYGYVSGVSWWMIGYALKSYFPLKLPHD
ncbi:O-antigen ligase family protein [Lunatibacter salilacus]|uniref:O-antigen ligase family protein n=1 Tax=Lunatibacter salilacus TaxID=2483804 RepID=UPI00131B02A3|nr:O-antigen ligase family protein [Lunatibacter salilacus]